MDYSPLGSPIHGIFQARILEWVAIPLPGDLPNLGIFPTQGSNLHPLHLPHWQVTNSWGLLKLMPIELVMPSNHLILYCPLLFLPSIFPSIRGLFK